MCHKIPHFIEKAARAGCHRVFIGLENINPDNLLSAKKKQNRITEYRTMLQRWKAVRVVVTAATFSVFRPITRKTSWGY